MTFNDFCKKKGIKGRNKEKFSEFLGPTIYNLLPFERWNQLVTAWRHRGKSNV